MAIANINTQDRSAARNIIFAKIFDRFILHDIQKSLPDYNNFQENFMKY